MKKIALVACCHKNNNLKGKEGIFKSIIERIKDYIKSFKIQEYFKDSIRPGIATDNIEISLIVLPYTIEELPKLSKRRVNQINMFFNHTSEENSLDSILLPKCIYDIHAFENAFKSPYNGDCLYRCLLANIIDEIFSFKGIKAWELDITIIQGPNREELYRIINLLSPLVRYLTVISHERERIESEAGEGFLDSGLAIMITEDYRSVFKNADLIINLDEETKLIHNVKTKSGAVIINYGDIDPAKIHENSMLINGIDINIPVNISNILGSNIYKYFSSLELAEIIIFNSIPSIEDKEYRRFLELENIISVVKMFIKGGYGISRFVGRRSMFSLRKSSIGEEGIKKVQ